MMVQEREGQRERERAYVHVCMVRILGALWFKSSASIQIKSKRVLWGFNYKG